MPFDQSTITNPRAIIDDAEMLVSWESSLPAGTPFQIYVDRRLAWIGTARAAMVPIAAGGTVQVDIGAVDADEASSDLSADLPAAPWDGKAHLTWIGGSYLGDLVGFAIYRGDDPGDAVNYATAVDHMPAYSGLPTDGAGMGGAGQGGAGRAAASYEWTSPDLASGTWNFGIKPYDSAGTEGTAEEVTIAIVGPPQPPAMRSDGHRLVISAFNAGTGVATLSWLASPT